MLAALLLAGIVVAPVSSAALFLPVHRPVRTAGWWPATRRLLLALVGTAVLAAVVAGAYLWELCDALGTERWRRRVTRETPVAEPSPAELPFVSLHVPAHNEPPEMVIQTLTSLLRIEYPRYEVVVIDDNTDDERLW